MRDTQLEDYILETAERYGGPGFAAGCRQRLTMGQEMYGNAWAARDIKDMVREIREESLDVGAWGVLAAQLVPSDDDYGERMLQIRALLQRAISRAAGIDADLRQILDLLAD